MKTYIDLHIHSTASDGTFSPTEIVNKALKLTEKDSPVVIALTDHDTVAGIDEFQKAAAKRQDGQEVLYYVCRYCIRVHGFQHHGNL